MADLAKSIESVGQAHAAYRDACLRAWACIQHVHPEVASWIRQFGYTDDQAALWLCATHARWGASPAEMIRDGRGGEVVTLLQQGFFGVYG